MYHLRNVTLSFTMHKCIIYECPFSRAPPSGGVGEGLPLNPSPQHLGTKKVTSFREVFCISESLCIMSPQYSLLLQNPDHLHNESVNEEPTLVHIELKAWANMERYCSIIIVPQRYNIFMTILCFLNIFIRYSPRKRFVSAAACSCHRAFLYNSSKVCPASFIQFFHPLQLRPEQ